MTFISLMNNYFIQRNHESINKNILLLSNIDFDML